MKDQGKRTCRKCGRAKGLGQFAGPAIVCRVCMGKAVKHVPTVPTSEEKGKLSVVPTSPVQLVPITPVHHRRYVAATHRAKTRLAKEHEGRYRVLLDEELKKAIS